MSLPVRARRPLLTDRDEIVVVQQHVNEIFSRTLCGSAEGGTLAFGTADNRFSRIGSAEQVSLRGEKAWAFAEFRLRGLARRI